MYRFVCLYTTNTVRYIIMKRGKSRSRLLRAGSGLACTLSKQRAWESAGYPFVYYKIFRVHLIHIYRICSHRYMHIRYICLYLFKPNCNGGSEPADARIQL